jgi:diadenosine tetraphosphatase ApaH/serine/threonine PP2A family protein phosphatase
VGVSAIWNSGDCVGYGAFPDECVALLREVCDQAVLGNYDAKVLEFPRRQKKWSRSKHPLKFLAFAYAWKHLAQPSRDWLAGLPRQVRLNVAGRQILLVHATPLADDDAVGPHTTAAYWQRCAEAAGGADLVLAGHIHHPFDRPGRPRFVFAGSVGRPEDGDPRAHYTLIEISGKEVKVNSRRVPYDVERAVQALDQAELPEAFAVMLRRGVDLKRALKITAEGSGS